MTEGYRRERQIRYMLDGKEVIAPLPPAMTDADAADIALRVTGLLYERRTTPWAHVIMRRAPAKEAIS